jgi:hypothetical protein
LRRSRDGDAACKPHEDITWAELQHCWDYP